MWRMGNIPSRRYYISLFSYTKNVVAEGTVLVLYNTNESVVWCYFLLTKYDFWSKKEKKFVAWCLFWYFFRCRDLNLQKIPGRHCPHIIPTPLYSQTLIKYSSFLGNLLLIFFLLLVHNTVFCVDQICPHFWATSQQKICFSV